MRVAPLGELHYATVYVTLYIFLHTVIIVFREMPTLRARKILESQNMAQKIESDTAFHLW